MMKKCTGESGDIGDIAKNVNIAMQKIAWQKWQKWQKFCHFCHFCQSKFLYPASNAETIDKVKRTK